MKRSDAQGNHDADAEPKAKDALMGDTRKSAEVTSGLSGSWRRSLQKPYTSTR